MPSSRVLVRAFAAIHASRSDCRYRTAFPVNLMKHGPPPVYRSCATLDTYSDLFPDDLDAVAAHLDEAVRKQSVGFLWVADRRDPVQILDRAAELR